MKTKIYELQKKVLHKEEITQEDLYNLIEIVAESKEYDNNIVRLNSRIDNLEDD